MALAAIAYAKALHRRRMMACTTSIGPGATNMITAAAVAHVDRLPVLLLPGDVFASRRPDPVLQQVESFGDGTVSANDCFRPVSRYFDRITRPEQIINALPRALSVLTDPADCGPVTLALCQDVQAEAFDYPEQFFARRVWHVRRVRPDEAELAEAARVLPRSKTAADHRRRRRALFRGNRGARPLRDSARHSCRGNPGRQERTAARSQLNLGAVGVTGSSAANEVAREADTILAVGTRLQDFTTGSWALFGNPQRRIIGLNVQAFDAGKHHMLPLVADARVGLTELGALLGRHRAPAASRQHRIMEAGRIHCHRAEQCRIAVRCPGHRRGATRAPRGCHRGVCRRRSAG